MKVWAAEFCEDDSGCDFTVLSLHTTEAAAQRVVDNLKKKERSFPWFDYEEWRVKEYEVLNEP